MLGRGSNSNLIPIGKELNRQRVSAIDDNRWPREQNQFVQVNKLIKGLLDLDDTRSVVLPDEIEKLAEGLARHAHNVWKARREKEGWKLGETWDGKAKTNPDLVEYEKLPDSEKQYSRDAALGVLKAIVALGFAIEREA